MEAMQEREARDLGNEVVSGSEQEYDLTPDEVGADVEMRDNRED